MAVNTTTETDLAAIDQQIFELQEQRRQLLTQANPDLTLRTDANVNPRQIWPSIKQIIQYSFSIGPYHYFRFHDAFNVPFERGLSTVTFWQEYEMNCTRKFLQAATLATLNCLKATVDDTGSISLKFGDAEQIQRAVYSRLQMPPETEIMYSFAAATYFDQYENPLTYEWAYGNEKKERFKKAIGARDFFLSIPLLELIPFTKSYEENFQAYDRMVAMETSSHWELVRKYLSSDQLTRLKI